MGDEPWEQILWSEAHQQMMYREWGLFFTRKHLLDKAADYYNKSLDIQAKNDGKALYFRSLCYCDIARTEDGLRDAKAAFGLESNSAPVNLQVSDAYYDSNDFENCKMELHKNAVKFRGKKLKPFENRMDILDQNYNECLGKTLTPFVQKNNKYFIKAHDKLRKTFDTNEKPLWKLLKEQGKCDVVSIFETEKKLIHPREMERRKLCYKRFNQVYFEKNWIDVIFLARLRDNKTLLLPQTKKSTENLSSWAHSHYNMVYKFLKMLQARSPLYTQKFKRCPNQELAAKEKENHLFRIQYQTRRDMYNMLKDMRVLRTEGKSKALAETVERVMANYVTLKTDRVMPWKFSFINEVYNLLALTYCDELKIPNNIIFISNPYNRVLRLLHMTNRDKDSVSEFVFGDKSTYQEPDAPDTTYIAYKRRTTKLEARLNFTDVSIEKCYIYHEIARNHLDQTKYDECVSVARKTIEEANNCNSYAWMLLGALLICKTNAAQRKLERIKESLLRAEEVAKKLNNAPIINLIELCQIYTEEALTGKSRSEGSMTKKKGSVVSHISEQFR